MHNKTAGRVFIQYFLKIMAKIQGVQIQDYFLGKNLFQLTPKFQQIRYLKIGQTLSRNGQKQENVKHRNT